MPLYRKERSFTFSSALTKVIPHHDLRLGVDVVHHRLNHRQAEFGNYGLKGGFSFSNNTTGAPGYTSPGFNNFAGFLLGLPSFYAKDEQPYEMTGREWQSAIYLQDRWAVNSKLTVSGGLRLENYPLMTRKDTGIERLDYSTYTMLLGGLGDVPKDVGINLQKWYFAPRVGAMYRITENQVMRAGIGQTINPLPWSRPMRGSFPFDISYNNTADQFMYLGTLAQGIPDVPIPDISSGRVKLPQGIFVRSPNPDQVDRGTIKQWNAAYEYRWPFDVATEFAYVGTATDGGYADLNINYGTPGGGNASRQYFALAGNTAINDWASRTKSRYHGLQIAINRPFSKGLLLKGAYTLSKSKNMADEDGWVGLDYNSPLVYDQNYAHRRLRPHARVPDGLRVCAAVAEGLAERCRHDPRRLAVERHLRRLLRHAVFHRRHQQRVELPELRLDSRQHQRRSRADGFGGIGDRAVLPGVDLLAADRRRRRGLRQQRPQRLPSSPGEEPRSVALQELPDRPGPSGVAHRGVERPQPPELGRAGDWHHGEQLHAVHAGQRGEQHELAGRAPRAGGVARAVLSARVRGPLPRTEFRGPLSS